MQSMIFFTSEKFERGLNIHRISMSFFDMQLQSSIHGLRTVMLCICDIASSLHDVEAVGFAATECSHLWK